MNKKELQKLTSLRKFGVPRKTICEAILQNELKTLFSGTVHNMDDSITRIAQVIDNFYTREMLNYGKE